jgi:hypothetical protein
MRKIAGGVLAASVLLSAAPALADFGVRLGTGASSVSADGKDPDASAPFVIGPAWKADLVAVQLEVDALYWRNHYDAGGKGIDENRLAVPALVKGSLPLVPLLLSLDIGAGLEPRLFISGDDLGTDDQKTMTLYLPIVAGATLDLHAVEANLEFRYERQISDSVDGSNFRNHQFMVFAGIFF